MATTLKAKHAFGSEANIDAALEAGTIDAYDILFLDEKKIGWIDKNGNKVIVEDKEQIVHVDTLPTENGDTSVLYIYNNLGYVWDDTQKKCVPIAEGADISALETDVANLKTAMDTKVNSDTVDAKIEAALTGMEIVEF